MRPLRMMDAEMNKSTQLKPEKPLISNEKKSNTTPVLNSFVWFAYHFFLSVLNEHEIHSNPCDILWTQNNLRVYLCGWTSSGRLVFAALHSCIFPLPHLTHLTTTSQQFQWFIHISYLREGHENVLFDIFLTPLSPQSHCLSLLCLTNSFSKTDPKEFQLWIVFVFYGSRNVWKITSTKSVVLYSFNCFCFGGGSLVESGIGVKD